MSSNGWGGTGWTPEAEYSSDSNDVLREFYLPALAQALTYDRITGFFASTALALYWGAIPGFVSRDGRMRILCSPRMADVDADGLERGYAARDDEELADLLKAEFDNLLETPELRKPALALAALISERVIDVRLARVYGAGLDDRRMFHDKVGVFADSQGQQIGFRGSLNETRFGLSSDGNIESFDAWASWTGGTDATRVIRASERFEKLWDGEVPGVEILELPGPMRDWLQVRAEGVSWSEIAKELGDRHQEVLRVRSAPDGRPLRKQQIRGLDSWEENDRRGILAHATGSGKTVTGITAIAGHPGAALVIAPSRLVARQWKAQIEATGRRVHICGDGETKWRDLLSDWVASDQTERVVVALAATASKPEFAQRCRNANNLLLVADEVHRLGAASFREILTIDAPSRLGLSATPERAGDPEGTEVLMEYFGGVVDTYTLEDALHDDVLCKYRYYPEVVLLDAAEQSDWDELTKRIGRLVARSGDGDALSDAAKTLIMQRARIVKKAASKVPLARKIIKDHFESGQRWLVYCDDQDQMTTIAQTLRDSGVPATTYFSEMPGDKEATLRHFSENGGVIVSIKCLDEGVDIPDASHALILASSRNPREFIQRRGRVLRKSRTKQMAIVFDAIVQPAAITDSAGASLLRGELARAGNFARSALNTDAREPLENLCMNLGEDLRVLYDLLGSAGEEDDDEFLDGHSASRTMSSSRRME